MSLGIRRYFNMTTSTETNQLNFGWGPTAPHSLLTSQTTEKTGELGFYEGKLHQKSVTITYMAGMPTSYDTVWEAVQDLTAEDFK